ncbi:unnamed protein product [Ambrosiozyma monospora]|uniref:Unnamed protein product n=1 Tax=Ambrosiozyma monospora TaxID=43982 RepID=A0ACB5TLD7_AMBMO|nr:unnamed protein product [Ambrosiozyma monospora]
MEKEKKEKDNEVVEEKVQGSTPLNKKLREEEVKNSEERASELGERNNIAEKKDDELQVLENGNSKEEEKKKEVSDNVTELKSPKAKLGTSPSDVQISGVAVKSPQLSHGGPPRHSNSRRINRNQTYVRQQSQPQARPQQESGHSKASSSSSSSSLLSSTVEFNNKSISAYSNKRTDDIKSVGFVSSSSASSYPSTVDNEFVADTKATQSRSPQKDNHFNSSRVENSTIISRPANISQTSGDGSRGRCRGRRGRGRGGPRRGVSGNSDVNRGASSFSRGSSEERRRSSNSVNGGFRDGSYNRGTHRSGLHENAFHNMRYVKPGLDGAGATSKESTATTKIDTDTT